MSLDLYAQIMQASAEIARLNDERAAMLQAWANSVSPLKVGELTPSKGYSFPGKPTRIIEVVGRLDWMKRPEVKVRAVVLKNDGSDSKHFCGWEVRPLAKLGAA